jgi:hypothetical protein
VTRNRTETGLLRPPCSASRSTARSPAREREGAFRPGPLRQVGGTDACWEPRIET